MDNDIISAIVLGLISGIIPGPVLTTTFTEILQSGVLKSFRIILWSMFIETIVALISLVALSSMNFSEAAFHIISLIGGVILIWISIGIWKVSKIDIEEKVHFSLVKITLMIMSNGVLWTFWITVCVPKAISLNDKFSYGSYLFLILVEIGWLVSTGLAAFAFSRFRTILSNPKVVPVVFKIFALTFVYFAIDMFYRSIVFLLN